MIPQTSSTENPQRVFFASLKPKRRFKTEKQTVEEPTDQQPPQHEPVLVNARMELRRHRDRITRSGRPNVKWHRVTSPTEFSELIPAQSRPPILAKVVDKVKTFPLRTGHGQGIWSLLRCWALAFR